MGLGVYEGASDSDTSSDCGGYPDGLAFHHDEMLLDVAYATHTPKIAREAFPPEVGIKLQRHRHGWQCWYPGAANPASERWSWHGVRPGPHRVLDEAMALQRCADFCWRWHSFFHP